MYFGPQGTKHPRLCRASFSRPDRSILGQLTDVLMLYFPRPSVWVSNFSPKRSVFGGFWGAQNFRPDWRIQVCICLLFFSMFFPVGCCVSKKSRTPRKFPEMVSCYGQDLLLDQVKDTRRGTGGPSSPTVSPNWPGPFRGAFNVAKMDTVMDGLKKTVPSCLLYWLLCYKMFMCNVHPLPCFFREWMVKWHHQSPMVTTLAPIPMRSNGFRCEVDVSQDAPTSLAARRGLLNSNVGWFNWWVMIHEFTPPKMNEFVPWKGTVLTVR